MPKTRSRPKPPARPRRLWLNIAALVCAVAGLGTVAVLANAPADAPRTRTTPPPVASTPPPSAIVHRADALTPKTLAELLALSPEQMERVDIAVANLLCATGLPGGDGLDIPVGLAKLDVWALAVKHNTDRHIYRLTDLATRTTTGARRRTFGRRFSCRRCKKTAEYGTTRTASTTQTSPTRATRSFTG